MAIYITIIQNRFAIYTNYDASKLFVLYAIFATKQHYINLL